MGKKASSTASARRTIKTDAATKKENISIITATTIVAVSYGESVYYGTKRGDMHKTCSIVAPIGNENIYYADNLTVIGKKCIICKKEIMTEKEREIILNLLEENRSQ